MKGYGLKIALHNLLLLSYLLLFLFLLAVFILHLPLDCHWILNLYLKPLDPMSLMEVVLWVGNLIFINILKGLNQIEIF